jgi:DNA-binding winged helix-turn-helix (wHTH) protein
MPLAPKYRFDQFEADVNAAELRRGGARLKLQMQPFQVLVALLERPGEVVSREELRQRLWPQDTFVDFDHGLNTAMAKLRDVLGDSPAVPRYIETIAKRGYRFLGEVQAVPAAAPARPFTIDATTGNAASKTIAGPQAGVEVPGSPDRAGFARAGEEASPPALNESTLPRAPRRVSRLLFVLAQVLYLIFYLSALFNLENLERAAYLWWPRAGRIVFVTFLVTAMVGMAVRLYLVTATAFDYHLLGEKYRVLFPALFVLDMIWALGPFLLINRMGLGLALGASAALIYVPFAQRTLVKMMRSLESP